MPSTIPSGIYELHLRHLGDEKKLSLVAELPTLWH
jgi:hypothetical protein